MSSKSGNITNIGTAAETASPHYRNRSGPRIAGPLDIVALISLHFRLIVSIILGGTILAAIAAFTLPKEFTASATLVFERADTRFSQAGEMLNSVDFSEAELRAELDTMRSRVFLENLVDSLKLMNDPSLNPDMVPGEGGIEHLPESTLRSQREYVISALESSISVKRATNSLTTIVSFTHREPNRATELANAIVDLYSRYSLQLKRDELVAAARAVEERTTLMEKRIAETEGAIADHTNANQNLRKDRLRSEIAQVQSQLDALQQQTGEEKSSSPQVQLLNDKLAEMTDELRQLFVADVQYRTLIKKLETFRSQRNRLVDQIVTLQGQADLQKSGVRIISYATIPTEPSFPRRKMILAAGFVGSLILALLLPFLVEELFGKVRSEQRLIQLTGLPNLAFIPELGPRGRINPVDFLRRLQSLALRHNPGPEVRINPVEFLKENPRSHYAAAMQSLIVCADIFRRRPTSKPSTEDISSTASLGGESTITGTEIDLITGTQVDLSVVNKVAENDHLAKVIAITSPLPDEGKSTLAIGLGITAARLGLKVILVDLDLHFGGISTIGEVNPGDRRLEAYLRAEPGLRLRECVVTLDSEIPKLDIIASTAESADPSTLLHSARPRLARMFRALKRKYDLVIVDTPPRLAVDDMSSVEDLLDDVFLVVRWGKTTERATSDVMRRLRMTNSPLAGTVINGATPRGGYGYALDSYYIPARRVLRRS